MRAERWSYLGKNIPGRGTAGAKVREQLLCVSVSVSEFQSIWGWISMCVSV